MKKVLLVFILFFVCLSLSFAWQENYTDESVEYKTYLTLKRFSGSQQPIPTLPISSDQLKNLVENLNTSSFTKSQMKMYNSLLDKLTEKDSTIKSNNQFKFNLEGWLGMNLLLRGGTDKTITWNQMHVPFSEEPSIFDVKAKMDITEFVHVRFDFTGCVFEEDATFNNLKFWSLEKIGSVSGKTPYVAYVSVGNKNLNFTIGRDRLSAGTANVSNLGLSHNTRFADYIKASVVYYPVSFDSTVIIYNGTNKVDSIDFNAPATFVAFHRFSVTPFKWFTLSAYEGCLQFGSLSAFDARFFNPLNIFHNTYAFEYGTQNNFFGVDANFSVLKNSEITIQALFDQIQRPNEVEDELGNLPPNAFGLLASFNSTWEVNSGILNTYAEAVYTSPALYLKEDYPEGTDIRYYQVDLYAYTTKDGGLIGHKFGSDTIAFSAGADYEKDKYKISSSLTFKATGSFGFSDGQIDHTGWTTEYYYLRTPSTFDGKVPTCSLCTDVKATYKPIDNVEINAVMSLDHDWNHSHVRGANWTDWQLYVGAKIDLIATAMSYFYK